MSACFLNRWVNMNMEYFDILIAIECVTCYTQCKDVRESVVFKEKERSIMKNWCSRVGKLSIGRIHVHGCDQRSDLGESASGNCVRTGRCLCGHHRFRGTFRFVQ